MPTASPRTARRLKDEEFACLGRRASVDRNLAAGGNHRLRKVVPLSVACSIRKEPRLRRCWSCSFVGVSV
jgi:hypothetical protein